MTSEWKEPIHLSRILDTGGDEGHYQTDADPKGKRYDSLFSKC